MQKILFVVLCAVITWFQYELWYGHGGIYNTLNLNVIIKNQTQLIQQLQERNNNVVERLSELKGSSELIEARARRELNLVKPNETLIMLPYNIESNIK